MLNPSMGFILYARVTVEYNGRAKSIIGPSNLCVIHKLDGSLIIHGATSCMPINYQRPKSTLELVGSQLICTSGKKDEQIKITIHHIHHYQELEEWSRDKLTMTGTEKQLCDQICGRIDETLGVKTTYVDREVKVEFGSIDILAIDEANVRHVIEVKRARITTNAVFQLKKYCDSMRYKSIGYVAAPDISPKALALVSSLGFRYIHAGFQYLTPA